MPNLVPRSDPYAGMRTGNTINLMFDPATGVHRPASEIMYGGRSGQKLLGTGGSTALVKRGPSSMLPYAFEASSPKVGPGMGAKFGRGFAKGLGRALSPIALAAETVFAGAIVTAGAIGGSAQWGAPTGLEEDYVGGAVFGATKGVGTAVGGAVGGIGGFALGAGIGTMIAPGVGTIAGGIIGGVISLATTLGGSIAGEMLGSALMQGPARQLGLGARAITKTARAVDRIQFGGNFVDSRGAYTMRQRAVSDMSGSMLNARQYLGNEAIFLHER